eukprot:CAMPEP_0185591630 /NCGR_PEP_ID=MMETSP0434-20130131/65159_1 /TAXON_ID=626734 ORGANISM="Favella taraikaensis, Strain Fe Narragansett Bay" /NCGR_SAMPLE_ID=MMETSP0434 /ASSEMBLY_ACC=CAM_ASM_000379 /LENGTH=109 /DNA_ID=CAMNT_0028216793 /DNA_START=310 /DNA_END=636 /DNA_ORIENTATION=+
MVGESRTGATEEPENDINDLGRVGSGTQHEHEVDKDEKQNHQLEELLQPLLVESACRRDRIDLFNEEKQKGSDYDSNDLNCNVETQSPHGISAHHKPLRPFGDAVENFT